MKNITTTRFSEKQTEIRQKREQAIEQYPALWAKMTFAWNRPGLTDTVWMMYAANYLFRTGNVRWAIDPFTLNWRLPDAPKVDIRRDLSGLSFVLLTHSHKDHLDLNLIYALRDLPIQWVIPEFLIPVVLQRVDLPKERVIVPQPLLPLELGGLRITPFEGQHLVHNPDGSINGVPAMGYLVETSHKRWLFPGDTRVYDAARLPLFGPVDTLFAHLWLGRRAALLDPPQYMEAFCKFCADLQPGRVILTHIEELGRAADDYWDGAHVAKIVSHFQKEYAEILIQPMRMGEQVAL